MKKINLIIVAIFLFINSIFGQSPNRYSDPNYMWNAFFEDFNKCNPSLNYSILSISTTCLILCRMLEKSQTEEFNKLCGTYPNLINYTRTGKTDDSKLINQIYDRSNLFYNSLRP